jgi:hypothetical protein
MCNEWCSEAVYGMSPCTVFYFGIKIILMVFQLFAWLYQ